MGHLEAVNWPKCADPGVPLRDPDRLGYKLCSSLEGVIQNHGVPLLQATPYGLLLDPEGKVIGNERSRFPASSGAQQRPCLQPLGCPQALQPLGASLVGSLHCCGHHRLCRAPVLTLLVWARAAGKGPQGMQRETRHVTRWSPKSHPMGDVRDS